jgi:hypothetical protein
LASAQLPIDRLTHLEQLLDRLDSIYSNMNEVQLSGMRARQPNGGNCGELALSDN